MIEIPHFHFNREEWVDGKLLSGVKLADLVCNNLSQKIHKLNEKPGLAALIVGDNPASQIYVHKKQKKAKEIGFHSEIRHLPSTASEKEIISIIHEWNQNKDIHGILVQLPLPESIDAQKVLKRNYSGKRCRWFSF